METATIKWGGGGGGELCHATKLSSPLPLMQKGRNNEERKAWDRSFAKLDMQYTHT